MARAARPDRARPGACPPGRPASLIAAYPMRCAMPVRTACRLCGRTFAPYGRGARTFCRRCAARADREAARTLRMDCKECGKGFVASRRSDRYCSDECRAEAARRRSREGQRRYVADPEKRAIALARTRASAAARAARKRGGRPPQRHAPPRADPNAGPSVCGLCGRTFAQYGRSNRHAYCRRCTARADSEVGRTLRAKCAECGGRFSTASRTVRYCSDECRAGSARRAVRERDRRFKADPARRVLAEAQKRALRAAHRAGAAGG